MTLLSLSYTLMILGVLSALASTAIVITGPATGWRPAAVRALERTGLVLVALSVVCGVVYFAAAFSQ